MLFAVINRSTSCLPYKRAIGRTNQPCQLPSCHSDCLGDRDGEWGVVELTVSVLNMVYELGIGLIQGDLFSLTLSENNWIVNRSAASFPRFHLT